MKSNKIVVLLVVALLQVMVGSCTGTSGSSETLVSKAPLTPPVATTSPSPQAAQITTKAVSPTATMLASTALPTATPKYTLEPTPPIIPILSVDDARNQLLDLLATNGDCPFPCLWGITPGQTTYQEAKSILIPLSNISDFTTFGSKVGTITPYYADDDLKTYLNIALLVSKDSIYQISFQAREFKEISRDQGGGVTDVFDSEIFKKRVAFYMLPNILTKNGRPSQVLLSTLAEYPSYRYGQGHFRILVLYPDQGFLIHYTTEMQVIGTDVVGCPSSAHVELEIIPSNAEDFQELLASSGWLDLMKGYQPIEDVTSMKIEDFYQLFRLSNEACIYTPAKYWPVPER